ncbi:hypothetical protein JZU46_06880, partial [bacterium]|nr:hypothetical protein [bacterium]
TEFGDLTSTASRATPFLGAVAGEPLLALDFSATIVIAVRMTLSVAAVTHTYTAIRSDAYCDRDVFVATPPPPTVLTLDWLEDLPVYNPSIIQPTLLPNTTGYPRLSTGTIKTFAMSDNQLSMFDVTCSKLATAMADGITASQAINATQMHAREWSPVAIQSYKDAVGSNVSGLAFVSIGPSTTEDILFAGHILYSGGRATLNAAITATATTVAVTNSSALKAGAYGVIRPAGSWATAELVYVASVSAANATATITRAYKSTARDHVAGEIIQMVEPMAADAPEGFGLNLSNACPVDGNGNKLNQALATIMAAYHDKTATLGALTCHVDGILWDSDWKYIFHKGADNADVDLDGVTDHGINLATGRNMWGDGLVDLSVNLRAALNARGLTGTIVMSGDMKACNQTVNAGGQFEGFRQVYSETGSGTANNDYFPRDFSALKNAMMTSGYGPQFFWDLQLKDGTQAYPGAGSATSNAPFRFGLGTALLFGASISCQNRPGSTVPLVPAEPWMWWDEYSVSTVPGADYGTAAAHTNFTALRAGVHWLGLPTGPARRLYDSEFEIEHNLITNGDFDVNTTGWSGTRITLSRDTAEKVNGTHSLKGVLTLPLTTHAASGAIITGQTINLTSGQHYTLCFAIASEYDRFVQPQVSNALTCKGLFIPGGSVWSRQVWSFRAPANSNEALRLNVGGVGG